MDVSREHFLATTTEENGGLIRFICGIPHIPCSFEYDNSHAATLLQINPLTGSWLRAGFELSTWDKVDA